MAINGYFATFAVMKRFSEEEAERYKAHIALCEIDVDGQQKLMRSSVAVVGAGALASPALYYLAAAGVGVIAVIDGDSVSLSNLQRQIIHSSDDIGMPKPLSAADKIRRLNPAVEVRPICCMLDDDNAADILQQYDVVLDCSDNYATRRLVSDTCRSLSQPLCFAALSRFEGQIMTFMPGAAYYTDVFPVSPTDDQQECRSCAVTGVLNALAGIAGSMQAAEAIKIIIGTGELLKDRMVLVDALTFRFETININQIHS